ncbi:sigma-E processing peptidase SpoIIGA [Clostridium omnivorum]|uniref:Sporulation sigma-E factor-processing peptidase n=1 Tax=Clostridium omnivorum TaxID=1604902 RepID=A0ABQ5NCZ8_9CLOT|nr:sigma-E processing peptidase SpoIIGA [Clostridium sp. E14]GLC32845.1 sigma-E processing peptidase SpoIIGA [Clostridium sp. E14]
MVVYLDTLLLVNFIVNYFLLDITSQTVKIPSKNRNLVLSSFLGSLYVIALLYPKAVIFTTLPFKIAVSIVMILICFKQRDVIVNLKITGIFILYSMLLAGVCFYLNISRGNEPEFSSVIYSFPYEWLLISLMIVYLIIHRLVVFIKDRRDISTLIFIVDIVTKDNKKRVKAFLDTGNELREPATNLPVIIVEKEAMLDVNLEKYDKFYIPYQVVNGYSDKMQGFKPDHVEVYYGNKVQYAEVIVAFCDNKLSNYNDYDALLSRGII